MAKRVVCLILIVMQVCMLGGCASLKPSISMFVYDENDTYISEYTYELENRATSFSVQKYYAQNSQSLQNNQLSQAIQSKTDLLLVNMVDRTASGAIIEKAAKGNLPTIFFNREPLITDMQHANAYYVGSDAEGTGILQAQMIINKIGQSYAASTFDKNSDGIMQVVVLRGERGHQDAEMRTAGCINELRNFYQLEILAMETADWKRLEAKEIMQTVYAEHGNNIEVIISNNDDMALGAIDYLLEVEALSPNTREYQQPILIIGVDGTSVGLAAVESGLLYGTVLNDAQQQIDAILQLADYILNKKSMDTFPYPLTLGKYVYISGKIILKD